MELLHLLEQFCPPLGPPGREEEISDALAAWLEPRARELAVDGLGNLRAFFGPTSRPRVMLDAHMDETALMVQCVGDSGLMRLAALGGVDPRILPGSRAILQVAPGQHLPAVVGMAPPHVEQAGDKDKALGWDKLYLDAGFKDPAEAEAAGVATGSCAVLDAGMGRLGADGFYARNLDDRAGCVVMLELAERLARRPPACEVVLSFTVGEEVGLRGATAAAFSLEPDLALCLEATVGDTPGLDAARQPSHLGRGPAVTVADGRIVVPRRLVESLEQAAEVAGVACQRKLPVYGGTDAGAIHTSRGGVPTCVLSLPTRYIHCPVSLCRLADLEAMAETAWAWLGLAPELA